MANGGGNLIDPITDASQKFMQDISAHEQLNKIHMHERKLEMERQKGANLRAQMQLEGQRAGIEAQREDTRTRSADYAALRRHEGAQQQQKQEHELRLQKEKALIDAKAMEAAAEESRQRELRDRRAEYAMFMAQQRLEAGAIEDVAEEVRRGEEHKIRQTLATVQAAGHGQKYAMDATRWANTEKQKIENAETVITALAEPMDLMLGHLNRGVLSHRSFFATRMAPTSPGRRKLGGRAADLAGNTISWEEYLKAGEDGHKAPYGEIRRRWRQGGEEGLRWVMAGMEKSGNLQGWLKYRGVSEDLLKWSWYPDIEVAGGGFFGLFDTIDVDKRDPTWAAVYYMRDLGKEMSSRLEGEEDLEGGPSIVSQVAAAMDHVGDFMWFSKSGDNPRAAEARGKLATLIEDNPQLGMALGEVLGKVQGAAQGAKMNILNLLEGPLSAERARAVGMEVDKDFSDKEMREALEANLEMYEQLTRVGLAAGAMGLGIPPSGTAARMRKVLEDFERQEVWKMKDPIDAAHQIVSANYPHLKRDSDAYRQKVQDLVEGMPVREGPTEREVQERFLQEELDLIEKGRAGVDQGLDRREKVMSELDTVFQELFDAIGGGP